MNRSSLFRFDLLLLVLCILSFSVKISSSSSSKKNPQGLIGEVGAGIGIGEGIIDIALPPILSPVIGGVEQLIFQDLRLAIVYPIIQSFKNIIVGDPLGITKTWVGSDICNYRGFYCENPPDNKSALALASIDFNGFQLTAPSIDGFIDKLPDLAIFHANSNNFSGTISPNIANLPYLYEFDVSNNQFSGPFPNAILAMPSLSFLDIRFNSFTGAIPSQLFVKDDLYAVFLNNNNFMQRLPDNGRTSSSSDILYLTLANNKFFGSIPRDISKSLVSLNEILLLNNLLSGCIPYELGFLKQAVVLDAGENRLTGPLPYSLGCLERVEILNFAGNQLYGMVPEVICALENLANLSLSNNYFTIIGPICLHLIKKGVLDLKNNCIPVLPFQRSVNDCAGFFARSRRCPFMGTYTYIPCWLDNFKSPPLSASDLAPSPS